MKPSTAAMVPDLKMPRSPRDLAFWQKRIAEGKPGTLMPAFAAAHGGPLTQEQADSLAVYLYQTFPRPAPSAAPPWQPIALSRALTRTHHNLNRRLPLKIRQLPRPGKTAPAHILEIPK